MRTGSDDGMKLKIMYQYKKYYVLPARLHLAFIVGLIVIGILTLFHPPIAHATQASIATNESANSLVNISVNNYIEAVTKASKGKLKLNLDTLEQARAPGDLLKDLKQGALPFITIAMSDLDLKDPLPSMDSVAFLAMNYARGKKLWSVVRPRLTDVLKAQGLRLLYSIPTSPPGLISQRPVTHTSEFRNRIVLDNGQPFANLIRASGAQGLRVKANAVASAFKHQGIDFIFISPEQAVRDKAWAYARYYTRISAWYPKHLLLVNEKYFSKLDGLLRESLLISATTSEQVAWTMSERRYKAQVQNLRDYGMKIIKPPVALQLGLQSLGRKVLFTWSEDAGDAGALQIESFYAIR